MNRNVSEKDQSIKKLRGHSGTRQHKQPFRFNWVGTGGGDSGGGVGVRGIRGVRVGDCVHTYLLMLLATL